jgi:hypothetical protein
LHFGFIEVKLKNIRGLSKKTRRFSMAKFSCPYLKGEVELSKEREKHIAERHPDLLPAHRKCIAETLFNPDQIRRSARFGNALLFYRWFEKGRGGKYVAVVVITNHAIGSLQLI